MIDYIFCVLVSQHLRSFGEVGNPTLRAASSSRGSDLKVRNLETVETAMLCPKKMAANLRDTNNAHDGFHMI